MAATLERGLAREILRGERAPGTQLPPVRALAATLGVTPPTIQRVIERLEAGGLVTARRGSGVTVNDPSARRDLAILPLWFDALSDQPDRCARMLGDFLELRRVVAAHLIRAAPERLAAAAPRILSLVGELTDDHPLDHVARTDLQLTRAIIAASDQFAVGALFHTVEQLVVAVPRVAEALYGDRAYHRRAIRRLIAALGGGGPAGNAARFEAALARWDHHTVTRFRDLLAAT